MTEPEQYRLDLEAPASRPVRLLGPQELFAAANEKLIDQLVENDWVEKKSGKTNRSTLSEYFSMWANTASDGGLILIGIENDGSKTGLLGLSDKQVAELDLVGPHLCPDARFERKRIRITNKDGKDDYALLFYVKYNKTRLVENHKHRAYLRRGDQKHELRDLEKTELRIDKGEIDLEDEFCGLQYPEDFDARAILEFSDTARKLSTVSLPRSDEECLELRRLGKVIDGRFRPNNACALIFAKDPQAKFPGCKITFIKFDGSTEGSGATYNAVKSVWIEGTIPNMIGAARDVIKANVREFQRLGPDGKWFRGPEYPEDAWYEAIVNACTHRSFNMRNTSVFVKMFDDRLEIESPGAFPPGITPENIYRHSLPRNRRLAEALTYLSYVRCENEGTRRMRDTMRASGLPAPTFTQSDVDGIKVKVVLQNNVALRKQYVDQRAIDAIGSDVFVALNDRERVIVNYVAEHGKITVSEASRIARGGWRQIKNILDYLVTQNVMSRVSPMEIERDPKAHYILKPRIGSIK